MITARVLTRYPKFMQLEVMYPDKKQPILEHLSDPESAQQFINYLNRQYIVIKLRAWLRQRQMALKGPNYQAYTLDTAKLIVLLGYYDRKHVKGLYNFVDVHRELFERISPPATSQHFEYYQKFIVPIMDFCQGKETENLYLLKSER
jgi:hypothetical protein